MKTLGVKEIMQILPHRHPFLLVDKAEIIEEGEQQIQAIIQAGSQYGSGS